MFSKLPKRKKPNDPVLASDWNLILDALEMRTPLPTSIDDLALQLTSKGFFYRLKKRFGDSVAAAPCEFGQIAKWVNAGNKTGIRGGTIIVGYDNYYMDNFEIDLTVAGDWLLSIEVDVVANRDDDDSLLLPGIESSSQPSLSWTKTAYTGTENYPSGTAVSLPTGAGSIVLPIGRVIVTIPAGAAPGTEGEIQFYPTGCGAFIIDHCAGSLNLTRSQYEEPLF